jgi:hypothetical protein
MTTDKVRRCVDHGLSVLVGAVSANGMPSCCRGIAITSGDDLATLTVYLPVATSHALVADVATTRRVAVYASHPIDHGSVQFKGTTTTVRLARPDEAPLIQARLGEYADLLELIGLPRDVTMSVNHWPAYALEVSVAEIFDQTPGPAAGVAIA